MQGEKCDRETVMFFFVIIRDKVFVCENATFRFVFYAP